MAPNDESKNQIENPNSVLAEPETQNVDDKLFKEMTLLQEKIQSKDIEKLTAAKKTDQNTYVINAMFKILIQMMPQMKEIRSSVQELTNFQNEVSEQVNSLKNENDQLKKRILEMELKNSSKSLIIKKLKPKHNKNEKENQIHLKKNFDGILDRMGVRNSIKVDDIFRFKSSDKETKPKQPLPVKVSFTSILDKNCFLASL